jgi:hypothetical protein
VNIAAPTVNTPTMTIRITAQCQQGTLKFSSSAAPGQIVQYRVSGTTAWLNLGSVNNDGTLITSTLDRTQTYDFQAVVKQSLPGAANGITKGWFGVKLNATGNSISTVGSGNSTTGNGPGQSLGSLTSATVSFSPDNKSGTMEVFYQVNPINCQ